MLSARRVTICRRPNVAVGFSLLGNFGAGAAGDLVRFLQNASNGSKATRKIAKYQFLSYCSNKVLQ